MDGWWKRVMMVVDGEDALDCSPPSMLAHKGA